MTENNADAENDAAPTVSQPVHLPDQQPIAAAPVAAPVVVAEKTSHTRTILEIVGGVVAVGLIFVSGAAGFVLGHVTAKHDGRGDGARVMMRLDRDDSGSGPSLERGQDSQGGSRSQGRPDFQGGQGMQGGPGMQGGQTFPGGPGMQGGQTFPGGPDLQSAPDGQPTYPDQDSTPVLPQQSTAPTAPQG